MHGNWLTTALQKEARYGGSDKERSIWYHGTTADRIPSILSQGLVPFHAKKVWDEDPESSFISPSRVSLGGTYLTTNLMTAKISASTALRRKNRKVKGEIAAIVVCELQPRNLVMDEDHVLTFSAAIAFEHPWIAAEAYLAKQLGTSRDLINDYRNEYVDRTINRVKSSFVHLSHLDPRLEQRLRQLFYDGWDIVLERQAAHAFDKGLVEWKNLI